MVKIETLKELAKKLSFYQSSISEEERISLILFSLRDFLKSQGIKILESDSSIIHATVSSAAEYFKDLNTKQITDLCWLKHGSSDLQLQYSADSNIEIVKTVENIENVYADYWGLISKCNGVTDPDFAGLDKFMSLLKALFFHATGIQPYNFQKSKPSLVSIQKMLNEAIPDLEQNEIKDVQVVIDRLESLESEAV